MQYRKLGNSSLKTSALGVGALHFGVFCDQEATTRIIQRALDLGMNFIDTAPMYGNANSESFVKNAIKGRRSEVIIGTKVGLEPHFLADGTFGVEVVALNKRNIRHSVEKSLSNLGTDYIDLYQIHAFDASTPVGETMEALEELIREGKIRFAGCSNYDDAELNDAVKAADRQKLVRLVSLQCHYNLIERRAEQAIVPTCIEKNCSIICYRALCRGILTGKYKYNQPFPEGSRAQISNRVRRWLSKETLLLTQAIENYAQKYSRTLSELAISWLLSRPGVATVLVGVRDIKQLEVCARATDWRLTKADLHEIDKTINELGMTSQVRSLPETFLEK